MPAHSGISPAAICVVSVAIYNMRRHERRPLREHNSSAMPRRGQAAMASMQAAKMAILRREGAGE